MKSSRDSVAALTLEFARTSLEKDLGKIRECLRLLSPQDIWWRPNAASNSAGNLCLHLCGNMRQWIVSGLGGARDVRVRDKEFSERGPLPRAFLLRKLDRTVAEALRVIGRLAPADLTRKRIIQGFHVTGYGALAQVVAHFSHHTGQITYLTKLRQGRDLKLTRLPALPRKKG